LVELQAEVVAAIEGKGEQQGKWIVSIWMPLFFHLDASIFPNMDRLGVRIKNH